MRKFVMVVVLIVCVAVVIVGRVYWNDRIREAAVQADDKVEEYRQKVQEQKEVQEELELAEFKKLLVNLPEPLATKILQVRGTDEKVSFVVMGSELMNVVQWTEGFPKLVNEQYGKDIFEFHYVNFGERTTLEVLHNELYSQAMELNPDIILFEPLLLNDNGVVAVRDTLYTVNWIGNALQETNPNAAYILMPSNPIHSPNTYQTQVDELEAFTKDAGYPYLDYWASWPDTESDEILEYLSDENELLPNEKGYDAWITFVVDYFTGK